MSTGYFEEMNFRVNTPTPYFKQSYFRLDPPTPAFEEPSPIPTNHLHARKDKYGPNKESLFMNYDYIILLIDKI